MKKIELRVLQRVNYMITYYEHKKNHIYKI